MVHIIKIKYLDQVIKGVAIKSQVFLLTSILKYNGSKD